MRGDLVRDLLHGQLLVSHPLAVQLQSEQPGRDPGHVKVGHFVVDIDKLLVLWNDSVERVGVVIDGCVGSHLT